MRRILISGAFLVALSHGPAMSAILAASPAQSDAVSKMVKGTITAITEESLDLEVTEGGTKSVMQFVVEKGIQVDGRVAVGATATVAYQPRTDGKNVALRVTVEGGKA
jgi:hypothetical protein